MSPREFQCYAIYAYQVDVADVDGGEDDVGQGRRRRVDAGDSASFDVRFNILIGNHISFILFRQWEKLNEITRLMLSAAFCRSYLEIQLMLSIYLSLSNMIKLSNYYFTYHYSF